MLVEIFLQQLVDILKQVQELRAIVLGGSYASGSQRPDSDIDIGLYYYEDQLLDVEYIRAIATRLNDAPDPIVTDLGGWGTWVNGGAWLTIQGRRVDFLYRNIDFVSSTLDECLEDELFKDFTSQIEKISFYSLFQHVILQNSMDTKHAIGDLRYT